MTIELKVPFLEKKDAVEFQKYLSENGCESHLVTETKMRNDSNCMGTIESFETFLESNAEEFFGTDSETLRSWLDQLKNNITQFYANHEPGIAYSLTTEEIIKMGGMDTGNLPPTAIDTDDVFDKHLILLKKFTAIMGTVQFLEKNGCIEIDPKTNGVTLVEKKPLGALVIKYPGNEIKEYFDEKELREYGILLEKYATIKYQYAVVAGPNIFRLDEDDILDFFAGKTGINLLYFEDLQDDIHDRFVFYRQVLDEIKIGEPSIHELIDMLEISPNGVSYHVDPEYMKGVIDDLKKLGLVTIKDGKIKPTKKLGEIDF